MNLFTKWLMEGYEEWKKSIPPIPKKETKRVMNIAEKIFGKGSDGEITDEKLEEFIKEKNKK